MKKLLIISFAICSFASCKGTREVVETTSRDSLAVQADATSVQTVYEFERKVDTIRIPAESVELNLDSLCANLVEYRKVITDNNPVTYGEGRAKLQLIKNAVGGLMVKSNCDSLEMALQAIEKRSYRAEQSAASQHISTTTNQSKAETTETQCVIPWFYKAACWFSVTILVYVLLKIALKFYFPLIKLP